MASDVPPIQPLPGHGKTAVDAIAGAGVVSLVDGCAAQYRGGSVSRDFAERWQPSAGGEIQIQAPFERQQKMSGEK